MGGWRAAGWRGMGTTLGWLQQKRSWALAGIRWDADDVREVGVSPLEEHLP